MNLTYWHFSDLLILTRHRYERESGIARTLSNRRH
jgi:hypothetical protein